MLLSIVQQDNDGHGVADVDWHSVFDGYTAALAAPACEYFYELSEGFPEAKVILTTRDPEAWWRSLKSTGEPRKRHKSATVHVMAMADLLREHQCSMRCIGTRHSNSPRSGSPLSKSSSSMLTSSIGNGLGNTAVLPLGRIVLKGAIRRSGRR